MREFDPLVAGYQHDRHRPRESEALLILRKVASLVKPIMRQRSWRVDALCEFYPHERNLLGLNINRGQKICLRLRYASDERQFIPIEQVVDTMLHELCHIVHGPHNRDFHALWNQLRDEHEELVRKGYTGEGFLSEGRRLGGQKMPIDEARRRARAAAEQRQILSAGSGRRLGGAPILRGTDRRRILADAAQRRMEVTQGCASGTEDAVRLAEEASQNSFRTKAEEDDANERAIMQAYIEMIQEEEREKYGSSYIPPSQEHPAGPRTNGSSPPPNPADIEPTSTPAPEPVSQPEQPPVPVADNESYSSPWICTVCTLENPAEYLCCDACAAERPTPLKARSTASSIADPTSRPRPRPPLSPITRKRPPEQSMRNILAMNKARAAEMIDKLGETASKRPLGWVCHVCGSFMETEWWTCSSCGTMKEVS